jgi:hypothetical protein
MNCGATYGAISLNNVIDSALYKEIYTILLVRLRAPKLPKNPLETRMIPAFPSILIMGCVDHGCRPE